MTRTFLSLLAVLPLFGQPPVPPRKAFEVTSIRRYQGDERRPGPLSVSSTLIRLQGYTVFGLVMDAYHLRDFQLSFGSVAPENDIYDTMYDIVARVPGEKPPSLDDARLMLETLLAERFQLKAHHESKEMPVYVLVAGRDPKLQPSNSGAPCTVRTVLAADGRNNEETFTNCPVERLADRLGNMIGDHPVLDRTGLAGTYDFKLIAIPAYRSRARTDPADIPPTSAVGELGLRMVMQKAPIDILVVDHLEKPTEN
jgi:uncharacterized protein (TIGR03435 family)